MQFTAKLIQLLPLQTGTSRNGEWRKQDIIVETQDQYPKKICVSLWGTKFQNMALNQGELYNISFDVESREYNGRWYTDVKAWKIEPQQSNTPATPDYQSQNDEGVPPPPPENSNTSFSVDEIDDLPF